MTIYFKKLVGDRCYLSPCSVADAEKWTTWDNDLRVALPLGGEAYTPYALEKMRTILADVAQQQNHIFTLVTLENDMPIGRGMLFDINPVNRCAMLGIVIGEITLWGKGYGQEAVRLLLDYGFTLLNLNSIMLGVFDFNTRAIHCYEKVGFKIIGRRRQARIIGQQKFDAIFMDILAEEFESPYVAPLLIQQN